MPRRGLLALVLALLMLASGCAAPARPTVEELRLKYPLYQQNPLVDVLWPTVGEYIDTMDTGVLATVVSGPEKITLKNQGADGNKAVTDLPPLAVTYERYILRVDTVIFGESPGSEVAIYLRYSADRLLAEQDIDQGTGKRFFYGLNRYPQEKQQQLETLLECNGIGRRLPIYQGVPVYYWTQQGYMLSAWPLRGVEAFDRMTKAEFIAAIQNLRDSASRRGAVDIEALRREYPIISGEGGAMTPLNDYIGFTAYGVLATVAEEPETLHLKNQRADDPDRKAVESMQALSVDYVRFVLRIDTVVFGSLRPREVVIYVRKGLADRIAKQGNGSRFFYHLFKEPKDEWATLEPLLKANGIDEKRTVLAGGPMFYRTEDDLMLSISGFGAEIAYDAMSSKDFVRAMRDLHEHFKDGEKPKWLEEE